MTRLHATVKLTLAVTITAMLSVTSVMQANAAEPRVTYVGDGRFVCQGDSAACAQVDANNRQREMQRQYQDQRDNDRANRYVEEQRRQDEQRRYDQR